jgi:hypothetical protein
VRLKIGEMRVSFLKNRMKKNGENEYCLRGIWDTTKHSNICTLTLPEEEERGNWKEYLKK